MEVTDPSTVVTLNTEFPADVVEAIPSNPALFTCGTYKLLEDESNPKKRIGSIRLYEYMNSGADKKVICHSILNHSAIFDLKWCRNDSNKRDILGVADTDGCICLMQMDYTNKEIIELSKIVVDDNQLMCSLDWSTNKYPSNDPKIITSDSGGWVTVLDVSNERTIEKLISWKAHDAESWICAFDASNPNTAYSGGDDCKLKIWDLRTNPTTCSFSKRHDMGVTSIHDNVRAENYLITGSYDENLSKWDKRIMKTPISSIALGGGVWKLKWHPCNDLILAACMHNGFHIIQSNPSIDEGLQVIRSYTKHESLAYGIDWLQSNDDTQAIASCSFYDNRLDVWETHLKSS